MQLSCPRRRGPSIPETFEIKREAAVYWVARSSRAMTAVHCLLAAPPSAPQPRRLMPRARHVFRVAAAILMDALGRQFQHAVRQRREKMPVVRDEQHGALVLGERRDQHLLGRDVEMIGRL